MQATSMRCVFNVKPCLSANLHGRIPLSMKVHAARTGTQVDARHTAFPWADAPHIDIHTLWYR